MKHIYFEIRNFKGVDKARLSFDGTPRGSVYTLVGLNESGKTTVLEALNFLSYKQETLDPLNLPGYSITDVHEIIPISKRSNFNDSIVVSAGYRLDTDDEQVIRELLISEVGFTPTQTIGSFRIDQKYSFNDSKLAENQPRVTWDIQFIGKKGRSRTERKLEGADWQAAVKCVQTILPSVLYFPNFLFEFPDKIYLETPPSEPRKHEFYRTILQDILDSIGEGTNWEKHILERAKSGDRHDKTALEGVLLKMGSNISTTVFSQWNQIFKQKIGRKEIVVTWDSDENDQVYLQLRLRDGDEQYSIGERSLGFRWFFAFLLLTHYRGSRKDPLRNVLFLLDEPASNLHPSAQAQLLDSFGKFPDTCSIVYTTHSHHMINPAWLENTFVVKNEGMVYNADDDEYRARNTVITLERYREFASKHPNQSTYFQPVLAVLDYCPSKLENVPNVIMLEGKNDFYTLHYFQDKILKRRIAENLMPGGGAGHLTSAIRLYLAWGREFVVLLDSDRAGTKERRRYVEMFGSLVENRIFTIDEINPGWKGMSMEQLLTENDQEAIQTAAYPAESNFVYNKVQFNRAMQELFLMDKQIPISKESTDRLTNVLEFLAARLAV